MGKFAIETRGLKKSFGTTHAVAGVDLAVSAGGVYGVLGPNGAGKTTTIKMLCTLLEPSGGVATINGYDVARQAGLVRQNLGAVLTGERSVYPAAAGAGGPRCPRRRRSARPR